MMTCQKCWNEFKEENLVDECFCSIECYEQNIKDAEAVLNDLLGHAFDENGQLKEECINVKKDSRYDEIL